MFLAEVWRDAAYEKGETQSFYNDFFDVFDVRRRSVARYEVHVEPGHRPAGTASSARAPRAPARVHDATPPQSRDSGQLTIQLMPKRSVHMPK